MRKNALVLTEAQYASYLKTAEKLRERSREASAKKGIPLPPKPSKMRNRRCVIDGIKFDSLKEGQKYRELKLLEKAGKVTDVRVKVRYPLYVNSVLICTYVADFVYKDNGLTCIVDVKPDYKSDAARKRYQATLPYRIFTMKKNLLFALTGDIIQEV